jgi:hypothetical protein
LLAGRGLIVWTCHAQSRTCNVGGGEHWPAKELLELLHETRIGAAEVLAAANIGIGRSTRLLRFTLIAGLLWLRLLGGFHMHVRLWPHMNLLRLGLIGAVNAAGLAAPAGDRGYHFGRHGFLL